MAEADQMGIFTDAVKQAESDKYSEALKKIDNAVKNIDQNP